MNANELRIGNWVIANGLYEGQEKQFKHFNDALTTVFFMDGFKIGYVGEYLKDIKPIPLTEEWLLKFGFMKSMSNWYSNNDYAIELCESFIQIDIGYTTITVDVKYVHQLQNLYFALTGEELEIS